MFKRRIDEGGRKDGALSTLRVLWIILVALFGATRFFPSIDAVIIRWIIMPGTGLDETSSRVFYVYITAVIAFAAIIWEFFLSSKFKDVRRAFENTQADIRRAMLRNPLVEALQDSEDPKSAQNIGAAFREFVGVLANKVRDSNRIWEKVIGPYLEEEGEVLKSDVIITDVTGYMRILERLILSIKERYGVQNVGLFDLTSVPPVIWFGPGRIGKFFDLAYGGGTGAPLLSASQKIQFEFLTRNLKKSVEGLLPAKKKAIICRIWYDRFNLSVSDSGFDPFKAEGIDYFDEYLKLHSSPHLARCLTEKRIEEMGKSNSTSDQNDAQQLRNILRFDEENASGNFGTDFMFLGTRSGAKTSDAGNDITDLDSVSWQCAIATNFSPHKKEVTIKVISGRRFEQHIAVSNLTLLSVQSERIKKRGA